MLIDAFQPEGITRLAVDSIFMMPHLGVLSTVDEQAATEVFERDCLIYLGTCAAPVGEGKFGEVCAEYAVDLAGGRREGELRIGELVLLPLEDGETAQMSLRPGRRWDAGAGPGQAINAVVHGGAVGLVLDGRGRPIELAPDDRLRQMAAWQGALNLYGEQ